MSAAVWTLLWTVSLFPIRAFAGGHVSTLASPGERIRRAWRLECENLRESVAEAHIRLQELDDLVEHSTWQNLVRLSKQKCMNAFARLGDCSGHGPLKPDAVKQIQSCLNRLQRLAAI
jgi:hypothetical protein